MGGPKSIKNIFERKFMSEKIELSANTSRRDFFKLGLASVAGFLTYALHSRTQAQERRRGGAKPGSEELKIVDPRTGVAAAVNYVEDKSAVKKPDLKVDRQGVKFEAQACKNCGFYTKDSDKGGREYGKCTIFPNQLVIGTGWCSSWNKKA